MHRIHPVCAETIQPHIGQHVCIITNDGKHLYGSLDGIRGGKLYLRGGLEGPRLSAVQKHAKSAGGSRRKGLQKTAKTKSYPYGYGSPYGGYGGYGGFGGHGFGSGFGIELALIATLFLLPFLFI
ncbi:hypothetical protein [Paenibacillus pinihumi]|uniref:hypothetical protein n=1 Tax=Paenibacillus pinihumi TaxID=669462 RepID=UPI000412E80F|nr:hypothetical protein [Paenibacillus pinihumi]